MGSNQGPAGYEPAALTNYANAPWCAAAIMRRSDCHILVKGDCEERKRTVWELNPRNPTAHEEVRQVKK